MTLIFAHRGYSVTFPENTMRAFIEAEKVRADGIELDVQMSKDGELVVFHDEKVDRFTDGTGYIKDLTIKEILKLKVSHKNKQEPIPLLQEVLQWMLTNSLIANIELKNGVIPYHGMEEKVIDLIYQYGLQDRIIFSSFNHYSIVHTVSIAPEIETAPIIGEGLYKPWIYAHAIRAKGFHQKYVAINDETVKASIESGIAVRPYTVNQKAVMEKFIKAGCSALITDLPEEALKIKSELEKP